MDTRQRVKQARENYLAKHPLKGRAGTVEEFPEVEAFEVTSVKFGYEYLMCINGDEDMDEWEDSALNAVAPSIEKLFLLAILRVMIPLKDALFSSMTREARLRMENYVVNSWEREIR